MSTETTQNMHFAEDSIEETIKDYFNSVSTESENPTPYDIALMVYQRIMEKHPSYLKAFQHKAALLVELKKYHEAAGVFTALLKINPQYYKAILGIGICFDKMGKISSAVRYYKKFLEIKPNSKNAPDVVARLEQIKKNRFQSENNFLQLA